MQFQALQLESSAGVATVTLNRPEKRNALSIELLNELFAALDEIERSEAHVLILTGAGKAFCAGMDLEELKTLTGKSHAESIEDSRRMAHVFRRIYDFPRPTIAAVNGAAIAGHDVRFHAGSARSKIRLHRSAHWIRAGDRFIDSGLASGA